MSLLADIFDRLAGVTALKERVVDLAAQHAEVRRIVLEQARELAEVKGQVKAMLALRREFGGAGPRVLPEPLPRSNSNDVYADADGCLAAISPQR